MKVAVKGAELFYSTRGSGPACFVLSGIGTKPYERMTPPALSERLCLVYVDLRGSGQSTGQAAEVTLDLVAEDLEAVRQDLGVHRIAVLGHSILGALAIEYGRRCASSVSHVIAVGTPPSGDMTRVAAASTAFFDAHASEERKRILRDNMAKVPSGAHPAQIVLAQSPMRFFDPRFDAAPLFAEADADARPGLLRHLMGSLLPSWDVAADAASLRVPMFLAHGRHDYAVPHVLWDGVLSKLPNATHRIFEESGHQPFFEEPELFASALTAWMGERR